MKQINIHTFKDKWNSYRKNPLSLILFILVTLAAAITILVLAFLIIYILVKGIPHLSWSLFAWEFNTLTMTGLSLLIAAPLGIFAAIYLAEYARRGNRLVGIIRLTAETLAGIPSIVYGLFGMIFFVLALKWEYSLLSGAFTLAIMILPLIMRTTEEALLSVPDSFREGSFGLGAGRLRTVFAIVLPSAIPGILAGVILAVGRIVGETAALLYTSGTVAAVPDSLMGSGRTLSVHMYALSSEALYMDQAYATAVVLLIIVIAINAFSNWVAKRIKKV